MIELRDRMRAFTDERAWAKFHDPKSLILTLVGEVGELAELFQWVPADEAVQRASEDPLRQRVGEELADVLAYLVRLADVLDIDLAEVTRRKVESSAERFPAAEFHGEAPEKVLDIEPDGLGEVIVRAGGRRLGVALMRRFVYDIEAGDESRWIRLRDDGSAVDLDGQRDRARRDRWDD